MNGQMHPTVGMNGVSGGFPREGVPLSQAGPMGPTMAQPGGIGYPQYQQGPVPVNGMNPQNWQPIPQQQMQQPQMVLQQPQMQQPVPQHPTAPWGQQFEQPGYVAPQPMRPQQQRLQVQGQEILDGPGVPLELRGRTMGQAMQIYQQLADDYIRRGRTQQPAAHPQQPGQQPQMQQPGQQPGQQPRPGFFQNPDQSIRQTVQEAVTEVLQPVTQFTQQQAIQQAYQYAQQTIPDLPQLQEELGTIIRETDPQYLAQPRFWEGAADLARGRLMKRQIMQQGQGQPQTQFYGPNGQARAVPAYQGFPQPTYQFFAEGPTPPQWGQPQQGYGEFSQDEIRAMQGFGMTPEQYRAYRGGAQQQQRRW